MLLVIIPVVAYTNNKALWYSIPPAFFVYNILTVRPDPALLDRFLYLNIGWLVLGLILVYLCSIAKKKKLVHRIRELGLKQPDE